VLSPVARAVDKSESPSWFRNGWRFQVLRSIHVAAESIAVRKARLGNRLSVHRQTAQKAANKPTLVVPEIQCYDRRPLSRGKRSTEGLERFIEWISAMLLHTEKSGKTSISPSRTALNPYRTFVERCNENFLPSRVSCSFGEANYKCSGIANINVRQTLFRRAIGGLCPFCRGKESEHSIYRVASDYSRLQDAE